MFSDECKISLSTMRGIYEADTTYHRYPTAEASGSLNSPERAVCS